MKSRPAPKATTEKRLFTRLEKDPQVRRWAQRLKGDPEAKPFDLSEDQLATVVDEVMKRRKEPLSARHFAKALEDTRPILSTPETTDPVADLDLIFQLPEVQEFWARWQRPEGKVGERGPRPSDEAVKALMTVMAIPGWTTHAQSAHKMLVGMHGLPEVFERVGEAGAERIGVKGPGRFDPLSYKGALKHRAKVAETCTMGAMATSLNLVKQLRSLLSDRIGEGLLIDGTMIPAWAPQVSGGDDEEREAALRRWAPEAGFRAYTHTPNGKLDIDQMPDQQLRAGIKGGRGKAMRGYYLVVLLDQATSLPLVWTLIDARENEDTAVVSLLSLLYRLWPECPAKWVAGDGAFNSQEICRLLMVDYGLHPIFRFHNRLQAKQIPNGEVRGNKLRELAKHGELVCAAHHEPLIYESMTMASRAGLRPGQASAERQFRYRVRCEHDHTPAGGARPCGRPSFPVMFDWCRLGYYPHHDNGRPDLFAFRKIIETARLGQVESCFQALKGGHVIGNGGAGRTRIRERHVHEALISLAFLGRVALTNADQLMQRDLFKPQPLDRGPRRPRSEGVKPEPKPAGEPADDERVEGSVEVEPNAADLAEVAVAVEAGDESDLVKAAVNGECRESSATAVAEASIQRATTTKDGSSSTRTVISTSLPAGRASWIVSGGSSAISSAQTQSGPTSSPRTNQ